MDTQTGDIFLSKEMLESRWYSADKDTDRRTPFLLQMKIAPIEKELISGILVDWIETSPRRNEKCPCGSDKKFKYCCLNV